jgi:hypothetical protein
MAAMTPMIPLLLALVAQAAEAPAAPKDVPIPEKVQAEAAEEEPPTVSIRVEENGDRVEEYAQGGHVFMVKVTPRRGPPYYLTDPDGNGRFNTDDRDPRISPVHWSIYEWD